MISAVGAIAPTDSADGERDRHVDLRVDARLGVTRRTEHRGSRHRDVVEAHVGESPGEVESVERDDGHARRRRVDHELGDAATVGGAHEEEVGAGSFRHQARDAVERVATARSGGAARHRLPGLRRGR